MRADVAQRKLEAMGYAGLERTTRRAVAEAKAIYAVGHRRRFRRWLPEPGCGSNGITPTAHWSTGARLSCGVPGWPGAAFGWCCEFGIRRCRPSSPASTPRCISSAVYRPLWCGRQREDANAGPHCADRVTSPDDGRSRPSLWSDRRRVSHRRACGVWALGLCTYLGVARQGRWLHAHAPIGMLLATRSRSGTIGGGLQRKVLVAEDHRELRAAISEYLRGEGFDVIAAENGATAMEAARANPPDVLVLDLSMPHMDGSGVLDS